VSKKKSKSIGGDAETMGGSAYPDADPVSDANHRVQIAREELRQAEEDLRRARQQAESGDAAADETTLKEVMGGILQWVSRHPATGIVGATLIGFFVGRGSRR
jgi:ElaB/YqjD/DUF883 family membrane-anchored ribosome-binding protein